MLERWVAFCERCNRLSVRTVLLILCLDGLLALLIILAAAQGRVM